MLSRVSSVHLKRDWRWRNEPAFTTRISFLDSSSSDSPQRRLSFILSFLHSLFPRPEWIDSPYVFLHLILDGAKASSQADGLVTLRLLLEVTTTSRSSMDLRTSVRPYVHISVYPYARLLWNKKGTNE